MFSAIYAAKMSRTAWIKDSDECLGILNTIKNERRSRNLWRIREEKIGIKMGWRAELETTTAKIRSNCDLYLTCLLKLRKCTS